MFSRWEEGGSVLVPMFDDCIVGKGSWERGGGVCGTKISAQQ